MRKACRTLPVAASQTSSLPLSPSASTRTGPSSENTYAGDGGTGKGISAPLARLQRRSRSLSSLSMPAISIFPSGEKSSVVQRPLIPARSLTSRRTARVPQLESAFVRGGKELAIGGNGDGTRLIARRRPTRHLPARLLAGGVPNTHHHGQPILEAGRREKRTVGGKHEPVSLKRLRWTRWRYKLLDSFAIPGPTRGSRPTARGPPFLADPYVPRPPPRACRPG